MNGSHPQIFRLDPVQRSQVKFLVANDLEEFLCALANNLLSFKLLLICCRL